MSVHRGAVVLVLNGIKYKEDVAHGKRYNTL